MSRSRSRTTAERRGLGALALAAALAAQLAATPASAALPWRAPYGEGEVVRFAGTVADGEGRPIADLDVALEASTRKLDWATMRGAAGEVVRRETRTDVRGEFALEWPWQSRFRRFELVAWVPVRSPRGEQREELARLDVTARVRRGSPVPAVLTVANARFVAALREFLAALTSADERRVYDEAGKPDAVDRREGGGQRESAWWYFELGRVYRFRDGRLTATETFDPVRPFGATGDPG